MSKSHLLPMAQRIAEQVAAAMQPFCERIEIAGSVRRRRPMVNDLDFMVLLGWRSANSFRVRASNNASVIKSGDDIFIIQLKDGTRVDFYFAHNGAGDLLEKEPGNWGSVLLCRTGSKEHNIYIASRARELGLKWETMRGITRAGAVIASLTEEEIFKALELDFVPAAKRERP